MPWKGKISGFAVMIHSGQGHFKSCISAWLLMLILKRGTTTDMSNNIENCHAFSTMDYLRLGKFQNRSKILEMHLRKSIKVKVIYFVRNRFACFSSKYPLQEQNSRFLMKMYACRNINIGVASNKSWCRKHIDLFCLHCIMVHFVALNSECLSTFNLPIQHLQITRQTYLYYSYVCLHLTYPCIWITYLLCNDIVWFLDSLHRPNFSVLKTIT